MVRRVALLALLLLASTSAWAQSEATQHVGVYVGTELDNAEDWILFGGEARLLVKEHNFEVNPRFTYHPFEGGNVVQIDVNVLRTLELAHPGKLRPYFGAGGALSRASFDDGDSKTKLGLNLVSGARYTRMNARLEPYMNFQYSIIRERLNSFTIVIGASFDLR